MVVLLHAAAKGRVLISHLLMIPANAWHFFQWITANQHIHAAKQGIGVEIKCYSSFILFDSSDSSSSWNLSQGKHLRECIQFHSHHSASFFHIFPSFHGHPRSSQDPPRAFQHLLLLRTFIMWTACGLQLAVSEDVAHQQRSHLLGCGDAEMAGKWHLPEDVKDCETNQPTPE